MVVVGGVIPPADYPELFAAGAKAVFGPGTNIAEAAADLIHKLNVKLGHAGKPPRSRSTAVMPAKAGIHASLHDKLRDVLAAETIASSDGSS